MKGKPLFVAVAAFVIVLLGGAAMASIGLQLNTGSDSESAYQAAEPKATVTTETPKATTTTTSLPAEDPNHHETTDKVEDEPVEPKEDEKTVSDEKATEEAAIFKLDYPADGSHVTSKVAAFGGSVAHGTSVHRGKYEATLHEGAWSMNLVLSPGKNHVAFKAVGPEGATAEASVTVFYDAPKDEEKDPPKDEKALFTANQKYGSCGEDVPYDVFYGTARPGAKITATSEYGSNSTTAGEHGKWEMKVKFPDSPSGKTFNVIIKASTGQSKTFTFTNTGSGKDH